MRLIPKDRDHRNLGWTPYAWLIYSIPFLINTYESRVAPALLTANLIAYAIFLALYFRGYWVHGRRLVAVISAMTLLAFVTIPVNPFAASFFIYAAAMVAFIEMGRPRLLYLGIYLIPIILYALATNQPIWFYIPSTVIAGLVGGVNVHYAQVWASNAKIRMAQSEIEHLAKIAERERIARDLHDVLGHTLSVIALKSELASKLIERDPVRAAQEIREVNDVARDALAQVRSAVTGYRASGLSAEFEAMRKAFDTAGVRLSVEAEPLTLPPTHENALALVLREASTNVLRHADAKTCRVRLAHRNNVALLEIVDDGKGGDPREGNGLTGMRERIAALGGSLIRDGRDGMRLEITLPLSPEPA
jgi:two-component system, NarL family, sensor histidine kinase DesK